MHLFFLLSIDSISNECRFSDIVKQLMSSSEEGDLSELKNILRYIEKNNLSQEILKRFDNPSIGGTVQNIVDINLDGETMLMKAAKGNKQEMCEYLINEGHADVNVEDNDQWTPLYTFTQRTPLHWACDNNNLELAKLLVIKDADVNAKDINQRTPLHMSCEKRNFEISHLLVSNGADVNAKDYIQKTPLHFSCEKSNFEISHLLVSNGANVNEKDNYQRTPLHWSCEKSNYEVSHLLVSKGARNERDYRKETPLEIGMEGNNLRLKELLRSHFST